MNLKGNLSLIIVYLDDKIRNDSEHNNNNWDEIMKASNYWMKQIRMNLKANDMLLCQLSAKLGIRSCLDGPRNFSRQMKYIGLGILGFGFGYTQIGKGKENKRGK